MPRGGVNRQICNLKHFEHGSKTDVRILRILSPEFLEIMSGLSGYETNYTKTKIMML
jgi:hypothetical protein